MGRGQHILSIDEINKNSKFINSKFSNEDNNGSQQSEANNQNIILEARTIWTSICPRLRSILGALDFKAWIAPLEIIKADDKIIIFNAANAFARSRIRTEYLHRLQKIWNDFDSQQRRMVIECDQSEKKQNDKKEANIQIKQNSFENGAHLTIENEPIDIALSPKTFENFETGNSNKVAVALAKRIAIETPNAELCYFYGYNGVGKTHLLSAIANQSHLSQKNKTIVSLSAQRFLNMFQTALRV